MSLGPWFAAFERMLGSARRHTTEGGAAPRSPPRAYGDTWHPGMARFLLLNNTLAMIDGVNVNAFL